MTHDPTTREGREKLRRLIAGDAPIWEWRLRAARALESMGVALDALDDKDAEIARLTAICDSTARALAVSVKEGVDKDAEIARLKKEFSAEIEETVHELSAEIIRLNDKLAAAERCLSNAWVDYDANPYQMATDEYDGQATGTLTVDATGENHWVQQLGTNGAKAAIGVSYDYWREKDRADHLEAKLTTLRDGIAEVVQVEGKTAGEFLLWPLGRMHVNSENEMVGCSPAGAKLAKLWRDSDPQETPKA